MDGAIEVFSESIGKDKVEKRGNSRIVRRDTEADQVHVFDAYDIGTSFKAITVKFEDLSIVHSLLSSFTGEVIKIIPDQDIKFDLPTSKKKALRRRYYIRTTKDQPQAERQGNFDYDSYEHDPGCPFAPKKAVDNIKKTVDSITHQKRAVTTKKKTTTKKATKKTTKKSIKKTTTKKTTKKATTKKTTTTVKESATTSCYPGSSGKKLGNGYYNYCCTSSDDCKDTCVSGRCNGPVNTKTSSVAQTATTKAATSTKSSTKSTTTTAPTSSSCYPGSSGKKLGNGYYNYCCTSSDDCKDTCVNGRCNGPVNTKTTVVAPTTTKASSATTTTTVTTTATTKSSTTTTTSSSTPSTTLAVGSYVKQTGAQWNLARISEHKLDFSKPYIYESNAGSDAYVYIIDDGLNLAHVEFEGRATWGFSAYSGISQLGEGHGTHVAGIVGSKTYGVAKKTKLIAVQVLQADGTGSISSLLAGLQWAANDAQSKKGKAIINMSLAVNTGGQTSSSYTALDNAVTALVQSGVPLIAAAGNWQLDACQVLPGGNKNVYSVAATDNTDAQAWYSDYGTCVSIYAPGSDITSTYIGSTTATTSMSGTSMSAPHVAGVAALLIGQLDNPTPANLYSQLTSLATKGVVTNASTGTVNALLFNGQQLTTN